MTYPGPAYGDGKDAQWTGTAPSSACSNTSGLTGKGGLISLPFNSAGIALLNEWTSGTGHPQRRFRRRRVAEQRAAYKEFDSFSDSNVASSQGGDCTGNCQPYLELTYSSDVPPQINSQFPPDNANSPR